MFGSLWKNMAEFFQATDEGLVQEMFRNIGLQAGVTCGDLAPAIWKPAHGL